MASNIDPTKPVDGVAASKAQLRANLQAAKDEIEALQAAPGGGAEAFTDLTDTPASISANEYVRGNSGGTALEFVQAAAGGDATTTTYTHSVTGAQSRTVHSRFVDQPVSILDFITAEADRTAIRNGTNTDDLTTVFHTARDQILATLSSPVRGSLHLPRGKYFVNFENDGSKIHLIGEYGGTILESFSAGGFAVVVLGGFTSGFTDHPWFTPQMINIGITGANRTKGGIYALRRVNLNNVGIMACAIGLIDNANFYGNRFNCKFIGNDVGVMLSSRFEGDLTVTDLEDNSGNPITITLPFPAETTGLFEHSGNKKFFDCQWNTNRIGIFTRGGAGHPSTPAVDLWGGAMEGHRIAIFHTASWPGWFEGFTINGMWLESNGVWGEQETVDGKTGWSGDIHVSQGPIAARHCRLYEGSSAVDGGELHADLCDVSNKFRTLTGGAIVLDRVTGDQDSLPVGVLVQRPRPFGNTNGAALGSGTFKFAKTSAPPPHGRVVVADTLTGSDFVSARLATTGTVTPTWQVTDGLFAGETCLEIVTANDSGIAFSLSGQLVADKSYALAIGVKAVGQGVTLGFINNLFKASNWDLPADQWVQLVATTYNQNTSTGLIVRSTGHSGENRTWRLSGIQLLEFPTRGEASEWVAGNSFHIVEQPI